MNKPLRILMVRPRPSPVTIGLQHVMVVEPLELEVLAALAGPADEVEIVDMILEKRDLDHFLRAHDPDVFCVTGYITHIPQMIDGCRAAKRFKPGCRTVVGGVQVEKFPEDIQDAAVDFRVVRNATVSFPGLLEHFRDPACAPVPPGVLAQGEALEEDRLPPYRFDFPIPRRDLTRKYRPSYFYVFHDKVALIKTSFGCPHGCSFCFCRKITDDHYAVRPIAHVIEELQGIHENEIYIVDDDFLVSRERVAEFLSFLRDRGIRKHYLVYGRADFIASHPDLIAEFKALGLRTIIIGLESFNDRELLDYRKGSPAAINDQAMDILNRNGVDCYAAIILSPDWGEEDFVRLRHKLSELRIEFVNLQPLTPLRGTGLQVEEGRLVVDRADFPRWDLAHVTVRPEKMTLAEYYGNIITTYRRVLFRPRYILRHLKYPLRMRAKLAKGVWRVSRQYRRISKEARCPK